MTTDTKLLPLPEEEWNVRYGYYADAMREYARANVAHATAPLQAEIEALKVDVEAWKASHSMLTDTCHHFQARAKRLVEALELAIEYWRDRQQRYKNRKPRWVAKAEAALAQQPPSAPVEEVHELSLCESSRVFLRPDRLYRFTVDPKCSMCAALDLYPTTAPENGRE